MNDPEEGLGYEPPTADLSDIDLQSALDRLADDECSASEEEALFARLDDAPEGWRACALTLLESRRWRKALATPDWNRERDLERSMSDVDFPLASNSLVDRPTDATRRRSLTRRAIAWCGSVALAASVAFVAGFAVANQPRPSEATLVNRHPDRDVQSLPGDSATATNDSASNPSASDAIASNDVPDREGPELLQVVYRPDADSPPVSASLPVYSSDEDWSRELRSAVQASDVDLAERRSKLLESGRDLERTLSLQPIETSDGQSLLIPLETYRIVPVSLSSFH